MNRRHTTIVPVLAIAAGLAGCGVKQSAVDQQITALRAEMTEADEALSSRVDGVDVRVDGLSAQVARMVEFEEELQSVRRDFDADIEQLQAAVRFNSPVHFEYDSDQIRPADAPLLDRFAAIASEYYPTAIITVEGFADPAGNRDYNLALGERRADAVRRYLIATGGLDGGLIRAVSYGEVRNRQIVPGAWGDHGLSNRRVSLVIDYSQVAGEMVTGTGTN